MSKRQRFLLAVMVIFSTLAAIDNNMAMRVVGLMGLFAAALLFWQWSE